MSDRKAFPHLSLLVFLMVFVLLAVMTVSSTVIADHTPDPASVAVAGDLQAELGCPGDWQPECAATELAYDLEDDVWQAMFAVPVGDWNYKAALNDSWAENYGAGSVQDGPNIPLSLAAATEVKFYYDHKSHWVTDSQNSRIATVPGSFQSELGCAGDWDPACLRSWLQDIDGDGIYHFSTGTIPAGSYEAKVAINESWDENYGADGVANGANIPFTVGASETVMFEFDTVTNILTISTAPTPPPGPTSVTIAGSLQSEAGCPGDWDPACAVTYLAYDWDDDVWQQTFALSAGSFEYKAALNDSWDENYGANAQPNGANIPLNLGVPLDVKFYYDHKSHWVTDNVNSTIATVAGNFQSAIGCPGDWQPDCLRSWMQDVEGDGVYTFETDQIPAGDYEFKVALDEAWDVSYPGANVSFTVPPGGDTVTFYYDAATNDVWEKVGIDVPNEELVRDALQAPIQDEIFYFVLPDRFDDGDPSNNEGAASGGSLAETGYLADDKSFYHGGDLQGLVDQLDYIENLGVTAIWVTPVLANRPTQPDVTTPYGIGGAYHGYWILDYENADPHLGTNAELQAFIDAAHGRGIKVFFDIVVNHTADIIAYAEGSSAYISKTDEPYRDANGDPFDDRDYAGTGTFPPLDRYVSFPYTPVFPEPGDELAKNPGWLNNPIYYHNRGDSSFIGENSLYGDFFGLDDLFTEHPDVEAGYIGIFKSLIDTYDIDGFRLDTVKHVNTEFWQSLAPEVMTYAQGLGKDDFFIFGEVFDGDPAVMSHYTTVGQLPSVLDFGLHGQGTGFAVHGNATDSLRDLFASDDYYTDADSNAYALGNFISNHDLGRLGYQLRAAHPGSSEAELVERMELGYGLLYFARGFPVIYYGDEQGFVGGGSDKLSREDMMPSQVPDYKDNDLIGTTATPADANFDAGHPVYQALVDYTGLYQDHLALRRGAQIHRYSEGTAGIYAFSRIERTEKVEYVLAFNNAASAKSAALATFMPSTTFSAVYPVGNAALTTDGNGQMTVDVPALSFVIYRADAPLPTSDAAPTPAFTLPAAGAEVFGQFEVAVSLSEDSFTEVTFAVKVNGSDYEILGTDTNAPYRVFYDPSELPVGTALTFRAITNDLFGHLDSATVSVVVGEEPVSAGPTHAVIHYYRDDGDYGDHTAGDYNDFWGLHLWEDIDEVIEWTNPKPFLGEDEYGRFAWVKLQQGASNVGFIVHRGDTKDGTDSDRFFNPGATPEIWLKNDDATTYTSQAAAQGFATIHYHRDDGDYGDPSSGDYNDFWGLHLWGDAIDPSEGTDWTSPKPFDGVDDFGAFWNIELQDPSQPLNFIIHLGDAKDPGPDQAFIPQEMATAWIMSGDETIYPQQGAAQGFVTLHYHRPAGDYGDYTSDDFNDFWGLHTWAGADDPGWTTPRKPAYEDTFGVAFEVPLFESATEIGYILHRGDEKDPDPDQFLNFDTWGYEVWQLQAKEAGTPNDPQFVYPLLSEPGANPGNISVQRAYWVDDKTILWSVAEDSSLSYTLHYVPEGGLEATDSGVGGGQFITLGPGSVSDAVAAKFPHLAELPALEIDAADLAMVPEILKGQIAISAVNTDGQSVDATGLQIPGVLDDLYAADAYDEQLGISWDDGVPAIRVWAPTAKSVVLHLFDDADPATTSIAMPMTLNPLSGVWSITGEAGWRDKYYLFDVEVYVHSTGQVEHNLVTDPYSLSLAMNSTRSQIVDLSDAALKPAGWESLEKPPLAAPEDISIYEIHVRDFSVNDPSVPEELKGTFKAFTLEDSNGMRHLQSLTEAGLSHLHLLPAFDIATINENKAEWQAPDHDVLATYPPDSEQQQAAVTETEDLDGFNWGYDPWHYTTPEGSYSTDPNGPARIVEFREMVQSLNEHGLLVVMDVVYNHTNAAGQDEKSVLDRVVPGYYHRLDDQGQVETSTCCQNTASEHNMMEKLMIDSLVTWAKEYKVDAFRFDLMGHHMVSNMLNVRAALDALTLEQDGVDGKSIYIYGEGWNFGEVANNARGVNATQLNLGGTGIATFSDRLRDAVRGGGPFDSGQDLIRRQGFANGLYYDPNDLNSGSQAELDALLLASDQIRVGMAGNLAGYQFIDRNGNLVTGADVDYNGQPAGYTEDPQEDITYISKHDNQTLYDNNTYKIPLGVSMEDRVRVQNVGLSTVLLGQGVPFMHAGSDLLRSKSFDRDSFNSGDWFNRLDFTYQANNYGVGLPVAGKNEDNWPIMAPLLANPDLKPAPADIVQMSDLFQELLQIRYSSELFRLETADEIQARVAFHNTGPSQIPGLIVMTLSDLIEPDFDPDLERIFVLINANEEDQDFNVTAAAGSYLELHPVQQNSVDPMVRMASFDQATGTFSILGRTAAVFVEYASPHERIEMLVDDVEALMAAGVLNYGQGNALIVKLEGALGKLNDGKTDVAINQLRAFVNQVHSLVDDDVLSPTQGQYLAGKANSIINQIDALY